MDAALKTKWVDALRSGEFEQRGSFLRRGGKHCCLGVLCEVAGLEIKPDTGNGIVGVPSGKDDYQPIYDLLGDPELASTLWRKNDGNGVPRETFHEIATYIEKNV